MIAIIDYGVGNLFSLCASLSQLKIPHKITKNQAEIAQATHIILPGVGAFGDASEKLFQSGMADVVISESKNKPLLGICVGMQLLFQESYEFGKHPGLGLLEGAVHPIESHMECPLKVPHMGWNRLKFHKNSPILSEIKENSYVYFVHSYSAHTKEEFVSSSAEYGMDVVATVEKNNIFGCQFHPEKSGEVGLQILKAFYEIQG